MAFVNRDGVRIYYEVRGRGPTVVSIPGLGCSVAIAKWIGYDKSLPGRRLILVDPRGHGRSDKPRDPVAHRIEEYRDDIRAVLDAQDVETAVLWGFSIGSDIACAFAAAYPNRVTALIDHDGMEAVDMCDPPGSQELRDWALAVRAHRVHILAQREAAEQYSTPPALRELFEQEDPEMVALEVESWTRWKGPASVLPGIRTPMLMLANSMREKGEVDRLRSLPGGPTEFHTIPETGHLRICFELQLTLPLIREFVARIQPKGSRPAGIGSAMAVR